jgi:type IV secretory pathway VirB4 component
MYYFHKSGANIFYSKSVISGVELVGKTEQLPNYKKSPYSLAGVSYPEMAERQHTFIAGAPGSGKSQLLRGLLDQIRAQGDIAIIYDCADLMTNCHQNGDIVFNPLDNRSVKFDPLAAFETELQCKQLSESIVKGKAEGNAKYFIEGARTVLTEFLIKGVSTGLSLAEVAEQFKLMSDAEIAEALKGTQAAKYAAAEETWGGLLSTVNNALAPLEYLHKTSEFDLKDYINNGTGWMWLTAQESTKTVNYPIIGMMLELISETILSSKPGRKKAIWLICDEFPSLPKLDSVPRLLAQGRKFGVAGVLGIQNVAQAKEVYGQTSAEAIVGLCSTFALLRTDGLTAEWCVKLLGNSKKKEKSTSETRAGEKEKSTNTSERDATSSVVIAGDIKSLKNLTAYISMPSIPVVGPIGWRFKKPENRIEQIDPVELKKIQKVKIETAQEKSVYDNFADFADKYE